MGPKWILARVRHVIVSDDRLDAINGAYVYIVALKPTQSGTPINRLSAHAAVGFLSDAGIENRWDDYGYDRFAIALKIDDAIRMLNEAMK